LNRTPEGLEGFCTYHALHCANEETIENLARLVTVTDILEGFGAVLAADVEEDFLATTREIVSGF
jgi:uncharacterized membrane protein